MALSVWTNSQIIAQLDSSARWYVASVSYSFPLSKSGIFGTYNETATFQPLNANQQVAAKLAVNLWDELISTYSPQVFGSSNIEFGNSSTNVLYAHSYLPGNGSVWFSTLDNGLQSPLVSEYSFEAILHEIGHAFGLDHMGNYNGSGNNQPSCYQDSTTYSIMSYFGPEHQLGEGRVAWADWFAADSKLYSPQTPMLNDILAIQSIYGPDLTTRTDDTVYGFNSNVTGDVANVYDFSKNWHPILTIYDAGGVNTLNLSGFSTPSTINLGSGEFTSCNSMTNNIAIAYSTKIHNVVGGIGNDVIKGNVLDNIINGGDGADTVVCSGNASQYKICLNTDGVYIKDTIVNRDGLDIINNIEKIKYSDQTISINYQKGSQGLDYAKFEGLLSQYSVWMGDSGVGIQDIVTNRDNLQILSGFERATFADYTLSFEVNGGAGQLVRLYEATLKRPPDFAGIGYWLHKMDMGTSLVEVAKTFVATNEFYAANTSETDFLTLVYNHVVHRDPDLGGRDYWLNALSLGESRAVVVVALSESSECRSQTVDLVVNGIKYTPWVEVLGP